MHTINPLLSVGDLPIYSIISAEHVGPAVDQVLADNRQALARLTEENPSDLGWEDFVLWIDELHVALDRVWSPVNHLNAVCSTPELREAHDAALAKISAYSTELGQNKILYKGFQTLLNSPNYIHFDVAQCSVIDHALRDFKLSGVHLEPASQQRFRELNLNLSELGSLFGNNVLDATQAWSRLLTDEAQLAGVPAAAKSLMAKIAKDRGMQGWLLTLDVPCVQAILTYAEDRMLREELYFNNVTRASEIGPNAGAFNNGPVMQQILECRAELAQLLGYENYAQLSLVSKMADFVPQVLEFLRQLAEHSRAGAMQELLQLSVFAAQQGVKDLQVWDIGYFSELYRQHYYALSQEALRRYFPVDHVLKGMFELVERLYGVQINELKDFDTWHSDVCFFEVVEQGEVVGRFFLDLYARPNKRAGAWMDGCRSRRRDGRGVLHTPMAYLVCNFAPALEGEPALLTHDEVLILFHEFGHGLHHLLTRVEQSSVAGVNGVAWDAVELPSQFMENWCWQPEVVRSLSCHVDTGNPLPDDLLKRLLESRGFQAGLAMSRQVEFALFDFELHASSEVLDPTVLMATVRQEVSLLPPPSYNRFANTFSHIFAGGYAAGYYSYKWAEVLAADAFSRFMEEGLFNPVVGKAFRETILAQGGAEPAMDLFKRFRGREPNINALLELSGLSRDLV